MLQFIYEINIYSQKNSKELGNQCLINYLEIIKVYPWVLGYHVGILRVRDIIN
jgi:hypothetical protein